MKRRLFTAVSFLSLLVCVAVCVLRLRSYDLSDQLIWRSAGGIRTIQSAKRSILIGLDRNNWPGHRPQGYKLWYGRDQATKPEGS